MICKVEHAFDLLIHLFQDLNTEEKRKKVLQIVEALAEQSKEVNLYDIYCNVIPTIVKLMSDENQAIARPALRCMS